MLLLKLGSLIQVGIAKGNFCLMVMWEVSPGETHCLSWPQTPGNNLFLIYQSSDWSNICYLANGLDFSYAINT